MNFVARLRGLRQYLQHSPLLRLVPYFIILLVNYIVYFKVLVFGYTSLDDYRLVFLNAPFLSDPASIITAFRQTVFNVPFDVYYRPVLMLTFIMDCLLGHHSPFMYHLSNLIYHVAACWLLFALLREMGNRRKLSLVLTLLFTVHPVLTQAVAWIPGRNDSLMGIFVFSAFICYARYIISGNYWYLACNGILFSLGLLTKETVLPVVVLFSLYHFLCQGKSIVWHRILLPWIMWVPIIITWFKIRAFVVPDLGSDLWFDLFKNLFVTLVPGVLQYFGKIFLPYNLSVMPYLKDISLVPGIAAVCLLFVMILLSRPKRMGIILFGTTWFLFFIAPVMLHNQPELYEHRLYVPMAGILMILPELSILRRVRASLLYGMGAAFFLLFAVSSFLHTDDFRSPFMFSLNAVTTSPSSARSHTILADSYFEKGYWKAVKHEEFRALEIEPHNARANMVLGQIKYYHDNDKRGAKYRFLVSCAANPGSDEAFAQLANLYYSMDRYPEAKYFILRAMRRNSGKPIYTVFCYDMVDLIRKSKNLPPAARPKVCSSAIAAL